MISKKNKIIALTGWGKPEIKEFSKEKIIIEIKNSLYPEEYGTSKYNVCFITAGFLAGTATAIFKKNYECRETKCKANGSKECEFEIIRK